MRDFNNKISEKIDNIYNDTQSRKGLDEYNEFSDTASNLSSRTRQSMKDFDASQPKKGTYQSKVEREEEKKYAKMMKDVLKTQQNLDAMSNYSGGTMT